MGRRNEWFFFVVLVVLSYLTFVLIGQYFGVIAFSVLLAVVLKPLYDFILGIKALRSNKSIAAILTLLFFVAILVIPFIVISSVTISQAKAFFSSISSSNASNYSTLSELLLDVKELWAEIPLINDVDFDSDQLRAWIVDFAKGMVTWLADVAISFGMSIPGMLTRLVLLIVILYTLLVSSDSLPHRFVQLAPLDGDIGERYLYKSAVMIKAMIKGVFVISFAQGLSAGVFYVLAGVPYALFWTVLSMFFAIVPLVGVSFVAVPIGILLLLSGDTVRALIILGGFYGVVANVDTVLRPRLVSKDAYLSPVLVLLSVFGGLSLYGIIGAIYGPVIMVLLVTTIDIYAEYYARENSFTDRTALESPAAADAAQIDA